jgi:hypothetical protein
MMGVLEAIEASGISTWVRESRSLFAYPMVLTLHTLGLSIIVGTSAVVDLRLLGVAAHVPLKPLKTLFPVMWIGFGVNAFSGVLLLARSATTVGISGVFWTKMVLIALSMWVLVRIKRKVFDGDSIDAGPIPNDARLLAFASILLWAAAITAGRLMAYIGASRPEALIGRIIG